jgi:hypothetical protein
MKKVSLIATMLITFASINAQTISEVVYENNIGSYALYVDGKSSANCYLSGGEKIIGFGIDFVLVEYNHIYFTYDCNCKKIASEMTGNMEILGVSGSTIKTKQLNGIYNYDKYWKLKN